MSARARLAAFAAVAVLVVVAVATYLLAARADRTAATDGAGSGRTAPAGVMPTGPRMLFRHMGTGADYGRLAAVPLDDPGGPRRLLADSCDRVHGTREHVLCVAPAEGVVPTWTAEVRSGSGEPVPLPLAGTPSRARLAPDGSYAATTTFVAGDSYAQGGFSTRTVVTRLRDGRSTDLEEFALVVDGDEVSPADRNYWGVTFAGDGDTFYVTVAFDRTTYLARGSLTSRRVETLRTDAECPSLSPDGTRVAYKKLGDRAPGDWRLAVLDLATGEETVLAERRGVDDQVEWLDDATVVYGLPGEGARAGEADVWAVPADGTGEPTLLVEQAWSPAVVR